MAYTRKDWLSARAEVDALRDKLVKAKREAAITADPDVVFTVVKGADILAGDRALLDEALDRLDVIEDELGGPPIACDRCGGLMLQNERWYVDGGDRYLCEACATPRMMEYV